MRFILKRLLTRRISSVQIVGEGDTAEKAFAELPLLRPDIVFVDISLPGMDGIQLVRELRGLGMRMVILTGHDVEQYRREAHAAGAAAIVSKDDAEGILQEVRAVAAP
jgi:DNA-binding NarL/FixJ family response regulator